LIRCARASCVSAISPFERAAFLLHDVFGLGFDEVAATIKCDAAACRQLAARARNHVRDDRPRFKLEKQRGIELANAFNCSGPTHNLRKS
jgi:RNA polymerase sigma-70 factor (ECF subfamily)